MGEGVVDYEGIQMMMLAGKALTALHPLLRASVCGEHTSGSTTPQNKALPPQPGGPNSGRAPSAAPKGSICTQMLAPTRHTIYETRHTENKSKLR